MIGCHRLQSYKCDSTHDYGWFAVNSLMWNTLNALIGFKVFVIIFFPFIIVFPVRIIIRNFSNPDVYPLGVESSCTQFFP